MKKVQGMYAFLPILTIEFSKNQLFVAIAN